eukprot:3383774-Amphidinium_carterae.1
MFLSKTVEWYPVDLDQKPSYSGKVPAFPSYTSTGKVMPPSKGKQSNHATSQQDRNTFGTTSAP